MSGAAWLGLAVTCVAAGCGGPKYPSCDNDENCTAEGHKGVCVNHSCVECRDDKACGTGKSCKAGACEAIIDFCDDSHACVGGGTCGKDHRCSKVVAAKTPVQCDDEHPCAAGQSCQNNHCVSPVAGGPGCTDFAAPKFDFESPELRPDTKSTLQRLAGCLANGTLKSARVLFTGHCDARGEYEFNMGLGAERAEMAKNFLVAAGVGADRISTSSRGKLDANGQDDAGYQNDRRVDVEVR